MNDMDQLPCGVMEVTNERLVQYCNQYVAQQLGVPQTEIVGKRLETIFSAASRIFLDSYVYPLLLKESSIEELQLTLQAQPSERIPIVINVTQNEQHSSLWTFMACRNRDKLYEELLAARGTLGEKAEELKTLNEQIHEENEKLQAFCYSLSHDFTGPIRRAQGFLDIATEELRCKAVDTEAEFMLLERASAALTSLKELVDGLIQLLVADADGQEHEIVELDDVIDAAIKHVEEPGSQPFQVTRGDLPQVLGTKVELQLLFKNLIGNSIKYCNKPAYVTITSSTETKPGYATISVKDNGIGIEPEYLDNIFEPFKRLHGSSAYRGSGLGLSIVKKLVHKHKGNISVESTVGEGSTFFVTLPLVQESEPGQPTLPSEG